MIRILAHTIKKTFLCQLRRPLTSTMTTTDTTTPQLFVPSSESLPGFPVPIRGNQFYVHEDLKGTEPAVATLSPPPPGMVAIWEVQSDEYSLQELGKSARAILDEYLPQMGAVLF
jgi:hypothetical protein